MLNVNVYFCMSIQGKGPEWEELRQAVSEQDRALGGFERLQYPQREDYPRLPADLYGEQDSREAQGRAKIVIEWAMKLHPGKHT